MDNYELVKTFVAEEMVINTGIKSHTLYKKIQDAGYMKTAKSVYSKKDINKMMNEIRNEWAEESFEQRTNARKRQLREIQLVKARLHQQGDYKTLERYLRLATDLLGTDTQDEREDDKLELEASARIKALELARQQEQLIMQPNEVDYLEVISD